MKASEGYLNASLTTIFNSFSLDPGLAPSFEEEVCVVARDLGGMRAGQT